MSNNAATKGGLKLRTNLQNSESDTKKEECQTDDETKKEECHTDDETKKEEDHTEEEFTVIEEVLSDSDDVQEVRISLH